MKVLLLILATALLAVHALQANPRVLKAPSDAISYARAGDRPLILFALLDNTEGSRNFAKLLNDNLLKMESDEFVIALCDASETANRSLFKNNFDLNLYKLPAVVITDTQGNRLVPSLRGVQKQDEYDRMIHAALVKAGLRPADAPVISSTTGEEIEGTSKIFRMTKEDVGTSEVVITKYRDWTLKNGETFHGALLKAEGAIGTFRLDKGPDKKVNFNDLSKEDVEFLQEALN